MSGPAPGAGPQLIVGVAQALEPTGPRRFLFDLLSWLHESGQPARVALLRPVPVRPQLQALADVRLMPDLSLWTPPALIERGLELLGRTDEAEAVRHLRRARRRHWLAGRPAVHLNQPQAVTLLRYLPGPAPFVSLYVHPGEILGLGDLAAPDRQLLHDQVDWYLAADHRTADELVGCHGVSPDLISVQSRPVVGVHDAPSPAAVRQARRQAGIPAGAPVVAIPAVPDWVDHPDLTVALAWELRRRRPHDPPHIRWYGGPHDRLRRWPIEHELRRLGLDTVHLDRDRSVADGGLAPVATGDVVVLPTRGPTDLDDVLLAQSWRRPAVCWSNHPVADEVREWTGGVVEFPDVDGMADLVLDLLDDETRRRRLAELGGRAIAGQRNAAMLAEELLGARSPVRR